MPLSRRRLLSVASSSPMSFSSSLVSAVRLRIYSRLMFLSLISATNSAWTWSMPKPIIRFGTTSASSSVSRMMAMARSISRRICSSPLSRWSFSFFRLRSNHTRLRTQSMRQAVHSSRISPTPMTRGLPATRMLKLQGKESISGVSLKSFCMSLSGSVPRLRSMAKRRPLRSVSSRMSLISRIFPEEISSRTLSITASEVVV